MNSNNTITTPISLNKRIYHPPLMKSLKYPTSNYLKTKQLYHKSDIPLFKKYSLFSKNKFNNNTVSSSSLIRSSNMSHMDYHKKENNRIIKDYNHKGVIYFKPRNNKEPASMNNSIEKDLNMMKLQMSCDLINHKINQIKDRVQNLHEASIKDDKNLINNNINNNAYKKTKSNNISSNPSKPRYIDSYLNKNIKRHVFMDFSKLRNKKFLKISNEMSREINSTFNNLKLDYNNDTFKTMKDTIKYPDININDISKREIELSHKNNLKHFLLNNRNNDGYMNYINKSNKNLNLYNDIDKFSYSYNINNINNNQRSKDNNINEIRPYNEKKEKVLNSDLLTEANNQIYFKYFKIDNENNNKDSKNIIIKNRNKKKDNVKTNNKEDINELNIPKYKKNNNTNNALFHQKYGTLDKYFIGNDFDKDDKNKIKQAKLDKNNQYKDMKNNNTNKEKGNKMNSYLENIEFDNNQIKKRDRNQNDYKLLLYSNLEQSQQDNLKLNRNIEPKSYKNNYIKIQNNLEKGAKIKTKDLQTNQNENDVLYNTNDKNMQNKEYKNQPISYVYLIDEKLKKSTNNNKKEKNNQNNNFTYNNLSIQKQNNNDDNSEDIINDNKFKININNISNYSIKNNCLNINNSLNKNKNLNEKNNTKENDNIVEESNKKEIKLTHNYSKDDLILTTDKMNLDHLSENEELNNDNNPYMKYNRDIIKRNMTFEKDEILLDTITEEENKEKIIKPKRRKNIILLPNRIRNKNNDKKIRIKHRELCHKFTDNPQHFFTVKLNELMLKALNINNKGKEGKK